MLCITIMPLCFVDTFFSAGINDDVSIGVREENPAISPATEDGRTYLSLVGYVINVNNLL